ncbi:MAG TPA: hypothetical protein VHW26_10130 [Solirubrobacteraceae bacterium]|nr:hypothetical protein [Solirubrobacteraceae bacterium]
MGGIDDFDLSAAGLRADGADLASAVEVLAAKLEDALGRHTDVKRKRKLLGKPGPVSEISVRIGECRYSLCPTSSGANASRLREVGGIAIKREALSIDDWLAGLTRDLEAEAERSAEARASLERLLD